MTTKNIFKPILFAVLSVATVFISCKKEPEVTPAIKFESVNALRQTVFADQVQAPQVIKFTTTGAWTSTVDWAPGSRNRNTPDWVIITPDRGSSEGEYTVTVLFGVNATGADRSAIIMLSLENSMVSITVTQKGTTATGTVPTTPTLPTVPINPTDPTIPTDPTDPTNPAYNMTGKINGVPFAWNGDAGVIDEYLWLDASPEEEVPYIALTVPANAEKGQSFPITLEGECNVFMMTATGDFIDVENGTLTVTGHNTAAKTIKGTFSFTAGSTTVSEGTFDYTYSGTGGGGGGGGGTPTTDYIKGKVNGADYSEIAMSASVDFGMGAKITVSSFTFGGDAKKLMSVSFPEGTGVGTYEITGQYGNYSANYDGNAATSGSITITSYDAVKEIVKGTFTFTAGAYTVTNGEFSAELP